MSVLITGGTGFVGRYVIQRVDEAVVTSRNRQGALDRLGDSVADVIQWSPKLDPLELDPAMDCRAVVNLMGDSIAEGRWTVAKKKSIRDSRVEGTLKLIEALSKLEKKPDVFVSASAVGFYGDPGDAEVTESHPIGEGYLPEVCKEWEDAADKVAELGVRLVKLRIGIVLGPDGGALEKMITLFKWGLGGRLGSGKQWFPWIHVEDLAGMIDWAIKTPSASGVYNATAPNPVTNGQFTTTLAKSLNRWAVLPAPKFGLRIALGEFANSLFFSQRVHFLRRRCGLK
jgi:uncharacterized protein (TIGR01777 family)